MKYRTQDYCRIGLWKKILFFSLAFLVSNTVLAQTSSFSETERMAKQGDAGAQYKLGFMYDYGQGVRQDYAQAIYWYRKAAELGNEKAQYSLGAMYHNGERVRQDMSIAKEWFGKSCDNGYQSGCDNYRTLNEQGVR